MARPKDQTVGPEDQTVRPEDQPVRPEDQPVRPKKNKIFLSGPMNSSSDVNGQLAISAVLKPTFNVYLAPVDGVEILSLIDLLDKPALLSPQFLRAALLVQQIGWAHAIRLISCDHARVEHGWPSPRRGCRRRGRHLIHGRKARRHL